MSLFSYGKLKTDIEEDIAPRNGILLLNKLTFTRNAELQLKYVIIS